MGVLVREKPRGSGEYWVFANHQGKRKAKKIGDRKSAVAIAKKIRDQFVRGDLGMLDESRKAPQFDEYAEQWLNGYVKTSCKYSTWQRYEGCVRNHLLPAFGSLAIDQIERKDIRQIICTKLAEGLSASSVKNIKATLSGILNSAFEDELITGNPALRLGKLIKKSDVKKNITPLTKEEALQLLEVARIHYPRQYPVFLLAVSTGMRLGEIIGLQPGNIDFNGSFIEVKRSIVRGRVETPKNGKARRVDLSKQLAEVLKAHLIGTKELTLKKGWKNTPETLFFNDEGWPLDTNNVVKRYFFKCLEKAGLRRVRFHDLRHTFASIHIAQGESLAYVRD